MPAKPSFLRAFLTDASFCPASFCGEKFRATDFQAFFYIHEKNRRRHASDFVFFTP